MAQRNFKDFLTAYTEYARGFAPESFHQWSALSIIAGALERKVWLPWSDTYSFYPNIYVLLVSMPGAGKSASLSKAVRLLQDMNLKTSSLNVMPNQATEAKFIELMGQGKPFQLGTRTIFQNAAYYWASEASNSLRNIFGDFIACLTDFYDCPDTWKRAVKKDGGRTIELKNVCLNLLAGSTFDYLNRLIGDENIMGGFASRPIYVVHKDDTVHKEEFQQGGMDEEERGLRAEYRAALIADLTDINNLVGAFHAEPEFKAAWREWRHDFETKRIAFTSEKLQSLLVRTNTNMLKVSMLIAASESSDLVLKVRHWERAWELIVPIVKGIPGLFQESKAANPTVPGNLQFAIISLLKSGPATDAKIVAMLTLKGSHKQEVESTLKALVTAGLIAECGASAAGITYKLLDEAHSNL